MSGYTKYKCEKDNNEALTKLNKLLKSVEPILPSQYNLDILKAILEKFYPYELFILNELYKYYNIKEKSLVSKGRKSRYKFNDVDSLLLKTKQYKIINSSYYKQKHEANFSSTRYTEALEKFSAIRNPKIERIVEKINKAKRKTQELEPAFLDSLIGLYDQKRTTQLDKIYIMRELQKYYCEKVLNFFSKRNDVEINRQLREMAFYHLQSLGFQPVLRKQKYIRIPSQNTKRRKFLRDVYANEKFDIKGIPQELEYRIENSKDQRLKSYDFFICHSSTDANEVQRLIKYLNSNNKNVYCDWISDTDYLKRNLVCQSTLNVIDVRIKQSDAVIFVESAKSKRSEWCKYELNRFKYEGKATYCLSVDDIRANCFKCKTYKDTWFVDPNFENIKLIQ